MMHRRTFQRGLAPFPLLPRFVVSVFADAAQAFRRVRRGEPGWPDPAPGRRGARRRRRNRLADGAHNYARLIKVKDRYDPNGLFFVHHGVGSEAWSADGFTKRG